MIMSMFGFGAKTESLFWQDHKHIQEKCNISGKIAGRNAWRWDVRGCYRYRIEQKSFLAEIDMVIE